MICYDLPPFFSSRVSTIRTSDSVPHGPKKLGDCLRCLAYPAIADSYRKNSRTARERMTAKDQRGHSREGSPQATAEKSLKSNPPSRALGLPEVQ